MSKNQATPKPGPVPSFPEDPGPITVAFSVIHVGGMYMPMRLEIQNEQVINEVQIAPAGPYRPIAYQYLAGKVMEFYQSLSMAEARKAVKGQ